MNKLFRAGPARGQDRTEQHHRHTTDRHTHSDTHTDTIQRRLLLKVIPVNSFVCDAPVRRRWVLRVPTVCSRTHADWGRSWPVDHVWGPQRIH